MDFEAEVIQVGRRSRLLGARGHSRSFSSSRVEQPRRDGDVGGKLRSRGAGQPARPRPRTCGGSYQK